MSKKPHMLVGRANCRGKEALTYLVPGMLIKLLAIL